MSDATPPPDPCSLVHDALSADLDGEDLGMPRVALDDHLDACPSCRAHEAALARAHRALRLRAAGPVPDLTEAVLSRVRPRRTAPLAVLRWALATTGGVLVVLGILGFLDGAAGEITHTHRELGAWYTAFGASLLVVARQPDRARGLLPFAALVGAGLAATALTDVVAGRSPALAEASHTLELLGVALVAAIARTAPPLPSAPRVLV